MDTKKITELKDKFSKHPFTKYIKGKNVIIVGPNTHLKGQGLGPYIDTFDIIIRINTVFDFLPFTEEYKKDYGSRTDILYWSPSCIKNYAKKASTIKKLKDNKIKYIVYQNGNRDRKYLTGDYCFPLALNWLKKYATSANVKLHYSHHSTKALTDMLNATGLSEKPIVPRTGFISILDMLIHGANKVETVGMSFSEGGGHSFRPDAIKDMDPLLTHKGNDSPHDSTVEVALAEELVKHYQLLFK